MLGAATLVLAILFGVALLGYQLIVEYWGVDPNSEQAINDASFPLQLVILIIAAPFEAGLAYMGWRKVNQLPTTLGQLFGPWAIATPLIVIAISSSMLANLGLSLFLLPGLYLMAVLSFANLYYLFRRGSPLKAMWESALVVHQNLLLIMVFHVVMGSLIVVSAVPFGLGLILTIPMYFYGKGLLFNQLFPNYKPNGSDTPAAEASPSQDKSSSFEA
ncbi:hypothetical protein [uncultured Ferrimonas sp.]|uniref:hypothetical protein n=1 Tax=uncultured Ferrimonas sp. TaxID=432640 RepID=UPI0026154FF5|nr:hypothetical protein [uncultured Ferrimonas sp.]